MRANPASVLLGLLLSFVALMLISASPLAQQLMRVAVQGHVSVSTIPDPATMVEVDEGAPYTVPVGKVLAITSLGRTVYNGHANAMLLVDGVYELKVHLEQASSPDATGGGCSMFPVPQGLMIGEGKVVTVEGSGLGRAWGVLVDA